MPTILFLTADPTEGSHLHLQREYREVEEKLKLSKNRSRFKLQIRTSARPQDVSQALLESRPLIVHFSGHGLSTGELCFENLTGDVQPVSTEALADLFSLFRGEIQCVLLNACYSATQARAVAQHVSYVVGMDQTIGDDVALAFSIGFYQALGAGKSLAEAYDFGCAQIRIQGFSDALKPTLIKSDTLIKAPPPLDYSSVDSALPNRRLRPFGEVDCETEVAILKDAYSNYYFAETPFNTLAVEPETYLIIGRRGSGKTALAEYFKFQDIYPRASAVYINESEAFYQVISQLNEGTAPSEIAVPKLAKIWEFILWQVIFWRLKDEDKQIASASLLDADSGTMPDNFVRMIDIFMNNADSLVEGAKAPSADFRENRAFVSAQEVVFKIAKKVPVFIAIDTLENVDVRSEAMLQSIAALIECASRFDRHYQVKNIFVKLFVMAEIFPHLKEEVILNPLKSIRNEIYMHWRPKDLMRLISWRFYQYLKVNDYLPQKKFEVDWKNFQDVLEKMWKPYFGVHVKNSRNLIEETFPYVLRHTQMRPRQLIELCDRIARIAQANNHFPHFQSSDLVKGIALAEVDLADEVINSYNRVYPKVGKILDAVKEMPVLFRGNELDKIAPKTASEWPNGHYSPYNFRQLVSELGIVGRVRHADRKTNIVAVDFEYASKTRLGLLSSDDCAIHPMFYKRLKINVSDDVKVYPFPDNPDYAELELPYGV